MGLLALDRTSGVMHLVRAAAVRPTVTRGLQRLAGRPLEVALLTTCLLGAGVAYLA